MFNKGPRQSSLMAEIAKDCERLLVEAAIGLVLPRIESGRFAAISEMNTRWF
jgi:hypothetical protein